MIKMDNSNSEELKRKASHFTRVLTNVLNEY